MGSVIVRMSEFILKIIYINLNISFLMFIYLINLLKIRVWEKSNLYHYLTDVSDWLQNKVYNINLKILWHQFFH